MRTRSTLLIGGSLLLAVGLSTPAHAQCACSGYGNGGYVGAGYGYAGGYGNAGGYGYAAPVYAYVVPAPVYYAAPAYAYAAPVYSAYAYAPPRYYAPRPTPYSYGYASA